MSNTVSVEILTTLNKQGIDDANQAVEELRNNVKSSPIDLFSDPQNESVQYFLESLNLYSSGLTTLQSQMNKFGKNFSQSLVAPFMDVTRTVSGLINQIKKDYGKGLDETSLITKSLGLREFAAKINAINEAYDQDLGWSKHAFKQNAPSLMNRAINNKIAELNAKQFKGQTPTLDRYVSVLANDNAIKNSFKAAGNGQEFTDQQIKNNLRLMLLTNNTSASRSIGQSLLAEAPFKTSKRHTYAHDIIPEQFRRAYYNNGSAEEQDIQNWRQSLKSPKQRINVKTGLYKELKDYIEHNDDASDVYDILEAAGVARREGGELRWAKSMTRAQAGKLAGLSLKQIADSRRGYAFYDSDIRDFSENTRQDRRMSGRVRSAIGVLNLLSRDGSIVADSNVNVNDYLRSPIEYRSSGSKIKTVGTPTQFIIPRTRVDSSTGRLVESDPNWKKKTGLFDQSEDDQFIVRTNSPIMKLISDIWKDSNGNNMGFGIGNGTFGFGRDNNTGKPIYKTPPILTLSTKPYFLKDGTINESKLPELRNLISKDYEYGGRKYSYLMQNEDSISLIENDLKKQIDAWAEERHIPSFFGGLNANGLRNIPEDKLIKQINNFSKSASSSMPYEEVFGQFEKPFQTRIMNMEALYDALGKKYEGKPNRIDGAALGSNKIFKNGPVQMRSAMGFAKYVMNPVDLDYMFKSILGTFDPDKVGESANGNWMVSNENGKLMYWAPSATADQQDVLDLMGRGRSLTDEQKRELRRQKFFKANADEVGAILTDSSVKQFEGFKFLDRKSYIGEYGEAGYEQARKEGRVNSSSGIVTLLPEEQGAFHDRATPHWMVMRTAYDLSSDPTIMSQQTAAAIGIDAKTQARSKEEFARRRFHLQSAEGRIEALRRNPYYSRLLEEDTNFAYSKEAESYIQSQIRGLKEKERAGYIALPDEVKAKDLVAAVTPMAWLEPLLEAAGKTVDDLPKELQNIATAELNNTNRITTSGKNLSLNKRAAFNRNPDAPDQRIVAYNMASRALGKFGITQEQLDNAIYLTTQQAYQMNTGDFDGDTIRMYAGLEDASYAHMDYISKKIQEAQAEIEKEESYKGKVEEPKAKTGDVLEGRIKALENYQKSTRAMGAASKIIRDAMDLPDSDPQKWKLAYKGMKAYDFASSDMRTKGQELKLDKDTESFLSNGGSYLRFVAKLNELAEEDGRDPYLEKEEEALDQLFKVKFATISGPQGALAVALRAIDYENGSTDFSDFNNNVNRLIERKYGKSASSEAQATRWYAKKFSEMMTGRAITDEDIVNGYDIAQRWEASLSGRNVSTDEEEYKKYNRFVRRIHELESGEGFTVKNLQTERDRILTEIANGNNVEENRDRFGLIDRLVKHQSKRQNDRVVDSAVRDAIKEQAKVVSYDAQAEKEAQKAAEEERLKNGVWDNDHIQMNWTSFKHWMPDKEYRLNTTEFTPSGARTGETTIKSFNNLADQILQAQVELRNQPFENEHTIQGKLMHEAFEQYFKAAADGTLNGRSIDDFYTDAYIGGYNDKLNQYGINISRISREGEKPLFEVKGDRNNTAVQKLNKILPTKNNPISSSAKFIKSLSDLGFDTEHPVNVEGDFYSYGANGESLGAIPMQKDFNVQIPIRDKDGQIVGYDTSKRTHAKPDLMLRNKNDGLLYTIDYKSSSEGAAESLIQSIFYNSIMDKYAQAYYENLHSPNPETNATAYKAFAGVGHWDDVAKKYVSELGGVIGYNPREDAHILARKAGNESIFAEIEKDVQYAMEHKMIDAKTLDDEGRAYAAAIARESREKRQAEEYTSRAQENHRDMSQKDREFFLSRYPSDLETMNQIRSSIFREMDLPERKFNRFENYRNKLMEVLPEEVVNAVAYGYDSDSPVREKLTDDVRQKLRLLSQIDKLGSEAAVTDWDKAGEDIINSLNGVQRSNTMKTLSGVTSRLLAAKSSRDFIKKMEVGGESIYRGYITKMGPTGEYKELADAYLSPEEQAELFNVDSDNTKLAEVAREQKKRFLESIDAEKVAMEEIKPALDRYLKSDKEAQDADWSNLIGEIQDPAEMIEAAFADKRKQIQQKIDNWSNEIKEASEKIANPDITEDEAEAYAKIIKDRQGRIQQADSFLESDKPEAIVKRDLQRRLGLITQTPEEIVENWRKQRRVAVAGNKLTQEESDAILYEEFQKTGLIPDYTRDASSIMSKEEEAKVEKINSQADDMLARLNRQRSDQLAKYQRELTNGNLTSTERADIKVQQLKDQITSQRDVLGLDDPLRNEYDKILNNKDLWDQYSKRNREDEYFREVMRNAQTRISKRNLNTLFSGEDFSAKEEFDQLYDQMKLQRDRYKAEHINDPGFDRNAFEQEYSNRRIASRAREQVSFNREQRNLQLDAEGYQLDAQLQGRSMTRDEEIQYRLAQAKASRNARAEKLRRAKRYSEQEALLLANTDPILEQRITEQYDNNQILRQLQRDNALASSAMQGDIRVHNMRRAFDQANRQQQMRYTRSRIAQALYGVEQRRENAREQLYSIDRQKEDAQRNQDYYAKQLEIAKKSGDQEKINAAQFGYDQATQQLTNLGKQSEEAQRQLNELNKGGQTAQAVFGAFGQTIGMVAQRLGRQLFQKALQETKRFVKEFDASMNEIQAITMKSDDEMASVRSSTINRAIGLRTSVSNVATTEAALYRQGLSDTEVASRTESIIKFATVTKLNVAEATKIITTALQNDLVPSAEAAMDALVALGDSAATTAAEIGKGMQKAAASAKVAGVSYQELTALLTIGTSDTQLSGTQVGTALQTVFSRMRRLSLTGYTADQNGEKTTTGDAEAALKAVGVELWDDKTIGKMRSGYEVLLDLSKVWQNLSDAQKNIVMNAMAGTRQTNIFSTLMEGMSENNGATLEKYLGLAEGSEGVTQSKYEIAMQSLAASMDTLKSSWDAVVESFINGGTVTGVLVTVSGFLQGFADLANGGVLSQAGAGLSVLAGGLTAVFTAVKLAKLGTLPGWIMTLIELAAGLVVGGGLASTFDGISSFFGSLTESDSARLERKSNEALSEVNSRKEFADQTRSKQESAISEVERLGKAYDKLSESQDKIAKAEAGNKLTESLQNLAAAFPEISDKVLIAIKSLSDWEDAVNAAKNTGDQYLKSTTKSTVEDVIKYQEDYAQDKYNDLAKSVLSKDTIAETLYAMNTPGIQEKENAYLEGMSESKSYWASTRIKEGRNRRAPLNEADYEIINKENEDFLNELETAKADQFRYLYYSNDSFRNLADQALDLTEYRDILGDEHKNHPLTAEGIKRFASAFDLVQNYGSFLLNSENDDVAMRTLTMNYAQEMIKQFPIDRLATNAMPSDFIQKVIFRMLSNEAFDEEGNLKGEYALEDGSLNTSAVTTFATSQIFDKWIKDPVGFYQDIERNAEASDWAYHINDNQGNLIKGFNTYEDAIKYVRENGLSYEGVLDQNGVSAYQNADNAIKALIQTTNANKTAQNLSKAISLIGESTSIEGLQDAYDKLGLGQELASVLGSNKELLGSYIMTTNGQMSYEDFQKAAKEFETGRTNRSDLIQNIYDSIRSGALSVEQLRTDSSFEGLYTTFKNLVGDAADAVLNNIEDGVYDANVSKAFNKSIVSQRIKEAMQFEDGYQEAQEAVLTAMYGTEQERSQAAGTKRTEMQQYYDYMAAVERYSKGEAREEDFAVIAGRDNNFSETMLRNSDLSAQVTANAALETQKRIDAQNKAIETQMIAAGLTMADYNKLDSFASDDQVAEYIKRTTGLSESNPAFAENFNRYKGNLTLRRYANAVTPGFTQGLSSLINNPYFVYDQNGRVTGIQPGSEEELTPEALMESYARQMNENSLTDIYNEYAEGRENELDPREIKRVLDSDEFLRNMLNHEVDPSVIQAYARRRALGNEGTFSQNYGFLMNELFGENWQAPSNWTIDHARNVYTEDSSARPLIDSMLSSMGDQGDAIRKYLDGEELPENFTETFTEWLSSEAFEGLRKQAELARTRGIIEGGTAQEQRSFLSDIYSQNRSLQLAQYGLGLGNTAEGRGYISSVLGYTDKELQDILSQDGGSDRIKNEIDTEIKELQDSFTTVVKSMFPDLNLDFTNVEQASADLDAALENTNSTIASIIRTWFNYVTNAGATPYESFGSVVESELKGTKETKAAMTEIGNLLSSGNRDYAGLLQNSNVQWGSIDQGLLYMLNSRAAGQTTFTDEMIDEAYANALYGRSSSPENQQRILSNLFGGDLSPENMISTYQKWMENQDQYAGQLSAFKSLDGIEEVTEAITSQENAVEKTTEALENYHKETGAKQVEYLKKYGKASKNVADYIRQLGAGAKSSQAAVGSLITNMNSLAYQNSLLQGISGKAGSALSGKQLEALSGPTNIPKEQLKKYGSDMISAVLEGAQDSIDERWAEEIASPLVGQVNAALSSGDHAIEIAEAIRVNTDVQTGQVDVSALANAVKAIDSNLYAVLQEYANKGATLTAELTGDGRTAGYVWKLLGASAGTKGVRTGGGGGGGKSAIDKMLEEQKFRVSDIQHRIKMTQIDETYQSNSNNTDAYIQDLRNEASLYDELEQELRNNIAEMEAQLKKLKEGSDEWKKLAESIRSVKEELEDIDKNKDFELTGKEIDSMLRSQEIADKPGAQTRTMLDIYAQRAMSEERYADYYSLSEQDLEAINAQKEMNTAQIAELEEQLKNAVEGDDNWIKTRDQIWEIEAENAKLENEAIQKQLEINETRLAQIAQVLQYDTGAANHNNNIAQTYQQYYQTGGYRSQYEDMINTQKENNASILEDTQAAYESALEQMNSLDEGTPAWYKARDAVYQYQESLAQLTVTQEDLNRALAESKLDSIAETYTDATRESSHVMDLNRSIASEALAEGDTETYRAAMEQVSEMREINLEKERDALSSLLDEYEAGMENGTLDPNLQRQYLDAINEREKAVLAMVQERAQQEREINKETIEQIKQDSEDLTRESTHVSNLTQMQANQHLAMGDYDSYQAMMGYVDDLENINLEALQSKLAEIRKTYDEGMKNGTLDADSQRSLLNMENETEEAIVKAYIAASNRMKEISKSNLNEIMRDNQMATRDSIRLTDLWKAQADEYLANNNYEGYAESMENAQRTVTISLEEETRTLDQLKAKYNELMETGNLDAAEQITWLNNIDQQQKKVLQKRQELNQSNRQKDSTMLNKMFDDQDRAASNASHNMSLLQYQDSVYQNRGELTNHGRAIEADTQLRQENIKRLTDEIDQIDAQIEYYRNKYGPGSKEELRLVEARKKHEEQILAENVQIDKNDRLLKENEKAILNVRKALHDTIDQEEEDRKRRERDQLSATVSTQNEILEVIKQRYQDEWDLRKKDLDKEKESLNEYKKLINERFNYRKKASQQADKDEELAEYRKQLALIEADPTRTKDAKELRRKIEELEEERSWTIAEDELNNENERIDDQIKTTDDYIAYNEEKLNELLSDANNFSTELNEIMSGSFEESYQKIIDFMSKTNEEFMKSLPEAQKQMIQGWEDTWKTARDIMDSNYPLIEELVNGGEDKYLEYFMNNDRMYRFYTENGDETNAALMVNRWREEYQNYAASLKDDFSFDPHDHEVEESNAGEMLLSGDAYIYDPKQLVINTNSISLGNNYLGLDNRAIVNRTTSGDADLSGYDPKDITGKGIDPSGFDNSNIKWTDKSTGEQYELNAYEGIGKVVEETEKTAENTGEIAENTAPGTINNNGERWYIYDENGKMLKETSSYNAAVSYRDKNVPGRNVITQVAPDSKGYNLDVAKRFVTTEEKTKAATETATNWLLEALKKNFANSIKDMLPKNANGGLVDYTGLAWVDGTKSRPESFLDATDTALLRGMLDAFDYVSVPSFHTPDFSSMMTGNTVGDINITINQAELKEDADYDKVAKKIGRAFTKELGKQGLSLAGYSFS